MKTIDRYIAGHFVRPFIVGVGGFTAAILGVEHFHEAAQLIVNEGFPIGLVMESFVLSIPMVVALTMPMATVFASLMASGELSNHGEIVAMRAGGVSVWRMGLPVLLAGLGVCILSFTFNEALGPRCGQKGTALLRDYLRKNRELETSIMFRMPEKGEIQRLVYADKLSVRERRMTNVTIIEFVGGKRAHVFFAERAEARGETWYLINTVHQIYDREGGGYREMFFSETVGHIGRSIEDIRFTTKKRPEDSTLKELWEETRDTVALRGVRPPGRNRGGVLLQHFHLRLAAPWAAVCFSVLGFPLGMRPQRTSAGTGFGISLGIVFLYYVVFHVLQAFGESGALSPVVAAWAPNAVVLGVGLGLLIDGSR